MKKSIFGVMGLAAISLAIVLIMAAGVLAADVSRGQFYTEEEYQKLGGKEREAYCASLAGEAERQASMLGDAEADLAAEQAKIDDLSNTLKQVNGELGPVQADVARLEKEIAQLEALPTEWTVQKGEFLYKISGYEQIYSDPVKWPRIYRANRDLIEDPHLIFPGWVLQIPRSWPTVHTVAEGEWLAKISGYWEIYGDWRQWTRIHEANKDKITDPDLILPGWELNIPR
ncbi:MAG: LysM peptidoglycan-binding domain-containing protein [Candidatus Eisenbacteria bacterium]